MELLNGDCIVEMKNISDSTIDLTVTSPPYDNLRNYNGNNKQWGEHVWKEVIKDLYRITKQGGVVVWVVGDMTVKGGETGTSFRQALWAQECGFVLHDTMIYEKNGSSFPSKNRYYQVFEYMFIWSKGIPKTVNLMADRKNKWTSSWGKHTKRNKNGELITGDYIHSKEYGVRFNIWRINGGHGYSTKDKIAYGHPAIFPEQLAHDHIISWSNEKDIVFDPFMGSGTTGKMAKILNREFIGIELDKTYYEIAQKRIVEMTKQQETFFLS